MGQAPDGWNARQILGSDVPKDITSWLGGGVWAANRTGSPATLIDSLGMGNSLTGGGVSVERGLNREAWSFALKALAFRSTNGADRFTVHQAHLSWQNPGGWRLGLEDEPLVWGYGLTGGYLLGEADRPFPRFRVESPHTQLSLFGASLGTWGFQWFTGRLENNRRVPDNSQEPSLRNRMIQVNGEPQSPMFTGYRIDGSFHDGKIECYANWTVLWGGTLDGVPMTSGYNLGEYLTAITGLKDPLAESSVNIFDPNHPFPQYKNGARSSSNFDLGLRFQLEPLADLFSADRTWGYISRGSKGMTLQWGLLVHKPFYWISQDLARDARYALKTDYRHAWYDTHNTVVPNLMAPDDTFGLLFQWPGLRVGIERRSTSNSPAIGYRSFVNDIYNSGFYRDGDPLGEALGGEADFTTLRLECDFTSRLSSTFWFIRGFRPFRDEPSYWATDHPGAKFSEDRFTDIQGDLAWNLDGERSIRAGFAWEGRPAADYIQGNQRNGFRWFVELSARWAR